MMTTKNGTQIFSKDRATERPGVFSHGWPINADALESQPQITNNNIPRHVGFIPDGVVPQSNQEIKI